MEIVEIEWIRYNHFFDLWRAHRRNAQLLYVIGDQHHCYIGSIGSRDGVQGLGTRYQWQYVHRARSIFGAQESAGQVAYAGQFKKPEQINGRLILAAEAFTQNCCITVLGPQAVLFDAEKIVKGVEIVNRGSLPPFLE
ncbi:MAG: hypothetical protein WCH04_05550 [Gammaproteobacteria bacterium]